MPLQLAKEEKTPAHHVRCIAYQLTQGGVTRSHSPET